jgi:hypothetical protein
MGQHGGVSTQSIVINKKNIVHLDLRFSTTLGWDPVHSEHPVRPNYAQLISSKVTPFFLQNKTNNQCHSQLRYHSFQIYNLEAISHK